MGEKIPTNGLRALFRRTVPTQGRHYLRRALESARAGLRRGFLHIFVGSTLVRLISALASLLLPNVLSPAQYGTLTVPDTFIGYVMLFNGFGTAAALLRYGAVKDAPGERRAYLRFSVRFGLLADLLLLCAAGGVLLLLSGSGVYPLAADEKKLLLWLAGWPVAQLLLDNLLFYFRATCENKAFGRVSLLYTAGYALLPVGFALLWRLPGVALGRYLGYAAALALGVRLLRHTASFREKPVRLSRGARAGMVRYGTHQMFASVFSQIMPLVEATVVNLFVGQVQRGEFRVASLLPSMLQYLTLSVVVFVFPYFARHYRDGAWVWRKARVMYLALAGVMAVLIPLGILITPWLLHTFYPGYDSREAIQVTSIYWLVFGVNAAFKTTTGNILAALGEVRFNLVVTFFASVAQAVFCYVLVARFALYGAAWGLFIAYASYSAAGVVYLRHYCKKMMRAAALQNGEKGGGGV